MPQLAGLVLKPRFYLNITTKSKLQGRISPTFSYLNKSNFSSNFSRSSYQKGRQKYKKKKEADKGIVGEIFTVVVVGVLLVGYILSKAQGGDSYRLNFGKYRGRKLEEVDSRYIDWLIKSDVAHDRPDLGTALESYQRRRR
jgi:hypothetical protein